jgi:short subunit fatty acids transporter
MNEFKFWVVIVTLIIFGMMLLSFMLVHQENRIKKLDALVLRMEEKEKKREKARRDPIDPE